MHTAAAGERYLVGRTGVVQIFDFDNNYMTHKTYLCGIADTPS